MICKFSIANQILQTWRAKCSAHYWVQHHEKLHRLANFLANNHTNGQWVVPEPHSDHNPRFPIPALYVNPEDHPILDHMVIGLASPGLQIF